MERTSLWCTAVIVVLYICFGTSTVSAGKCSGKWAIHACAGGNGKRADMSPLEGLSRKQKFEEYLRNKLVRSAAEGAQADDVFGDSYEKDMDFQQAALTPRKVSPILLRKLIRSLHKGLSKARLDDTERY